jgi:outer membrane protein assembly factor BamB
MKGAGPAADSSGNIYAETGEGPFAAGTNFGISVLKFTQNGTSLGLTDWFTPYNYEFLAQNDKDLSNGVLVLPDQPLPPPYTHELIAIGKEGSIYLLNRDNMGQLCPNCTTTDTQIVQEVPQGAGKLSGTPVYWNNTVYVTGTSLPVYGYSLQNGTLVTPPSLQSAQAMGGGGNSILTANGTTNGILWFTSAGANLYALNASNLQLLWVSTQAANDRDTVGPLPHFATPIAVDGKVFLGTESSLLVYGLLSEQTTAKNHRPSWISERGVRALEVLPF